MCNSSWTERLWQVLKSHAKTDPQGNLVPGVRIAILGIGNSLNGDDGAGPAVVQALQRARGSTGNILILDAGPAPENFTSDLRRFKPDLVLMVDAAEMGTAAGTIMLLETGQVDGFGASTHLYPPSTLAGFLSSELGCSTVVLGIQPQSLVFDQPLTKPVEEAVQACVDGVIKVLKHLNGNQ